MEIVLLAIILIIILILRNSISDNNTLIRQLKNSVYDLESEIRSLNKKLNESEVSKPGEKIQPIVTPPPVHEPLRAFAPPTQISVKEEDDETTGPVLKVEAPSYKPPSAVAPEPKEGWFETWLKNNPDMEKFIGENLINKIGIAVLVLGIAFFVKYAIDQNWINTTGRVGIGLLCGGILIGFAHRLRNTYRSFSSVLVGGGLTVFYFTIAIAYNDYGLLTQTPAFICMIVITIFAVILSLAYDRMELAVLATIGGFITPFLVSSGNENYVALFTYLGVLNAGLIILGYFKQWRILNFISLLFTLIIYGAWFSKHIFKDSLPYTHAFIFASIFYFLFLTMNLISQFSVKDKLKAFDFGILLVINLAYYGAGITILEQSGAEQYKGIFTAVLGMINLVLAYVLFKSKSLDKNFIYLLIGLTITYISLTAPVQLEGNYITLFWAAEAVLLLWLYQHSFIKLVKYAALMVTACMLISLVMDWINVYSFYSADILPVIINKGFITTIFAAASLLISYQLFKKEADSYYATGISNNFIRTSYSTVAIILLVVCGLIEINYQFTRRFPYTGLNFVYLQLYAISFFTIIFTIAEKMKWKFDEYLRTAVTVLLFGLYIRNATNIYQTEIDILTSGKNNVHLVAYIFNAAAILGLLLQSLLHLAAHKEKYKATFPAFTTILSLALVSVLSIQVRYFYVWSTYSDVSGITYAENLYGKAILTIIWGLSSFAMIWFGMKYGFRSLRITALVLFGVTLIKLFSYDIQNIPPAGKIAAFILLGILLLVVSFMYQRLKKFIIDNEETE